MTLASLFQDIMVMCLLLLGGFVIRSFIPPLQKLFLPASVIAGVLGLILGDQVLGLITIPESFSGFSDVMMRIIMTCVVFGVTVSFGQMLDHMDYALSNIFLYGAQMIVGVGVAAACALFAPGMPEGGGVLGTFAYFGSHGSAGAAATVMEDMGVEGAMDIGMVLATGGLVWSMVVGMIIVNWGVRKGYATFVKEPTKQPPYFYKGILPADKRESLGSATTTPVAVNPLMFHLALIMLCYALGYGIFSILTTYIPVLSKINAMLYGMIGGLLIWPVMRKTNTSGYVDKKILNQISGFCLEIIIVTAIASLSMDIVTKYWLPLLLHIVIGCGLTTLFCVWFLRKVGNPQWFEKCLMVIGCCTGASAQGLALVRAVDPDSQSIAPQAHGVYNAIFWWNNLLTPILPALMLTSTVSLLGVASLFVIGAMILMYFLCFRRKHH